MRQFNETSEPKPKTINWFLPTFERAYGGINTILRFADYFHSHKNIRNTFVICGPEKNGVANAKEAITQAYPNLSTENILQLTTGNSVNLPYADISIASYWTTAYHLLKFNNTKGKFYFIQDYEPLFFPAGFTYGLAEATYRFGFHAIINTLGLCSEYQKTYSTPTAYFTPSVDSEVFYPSKIETPKQNKPFTIFFYGRPNPRNAFELGLLALKQIKKKYGDQVKIYSAGANWSRKTYDREGNIENLGVLPYKKTADLYRSCNLGVVFMFTKHPSYLPFELMACGCPVLMNTNAATAWLLEDNINCALTEPTVSSVCERIETLIANPDLCRQISINGLKTVQRTNWQEEIERIYSFITKSIGGANQK
jgi:glycosyltransferase involved in cell wall biosynthesis